MTHTVPPTSLDAWLARLEAAHPVGIDLGLERVAEVARRMGLGDAPLAERIITVAGTNGKGSTVAMLEALGRTHGLTTAAYTSPHLLRYNERLRLDGVEASDDLLIAGFEVVERARLGDVPVSLTYFEVGTLGAFWAIARHRPDLAILEVGLGGRLDAVNIIDAHVAVVTTIAHDHAAFLGNDLNVIGREKAGILRPARPAVLGSPSLPESVREVAAELGARVYALDEAFRRLPSEGGWHWQGCDATGVVRELEALPDPGLPLDNAATALQALLLADVTLEEASCRRALDGIDLPGRMQWRGQWCLDVGHNPHAAGHLAERLAAVPAQGRTIALLGMLADKDADGVITALAPVVDAWVPVSLGGERARQASDLAGRLAERGMAIWHLADSPRAGAEWLAACLAPEDRVLVTGSFFTVAEVLASWHAPAQTEEENSAMEGAP